MKYSLITTEALQTRRHVLSKHLFITIIIRIWLIIRCFPTKQKVIKMLLYNSLMNGNTYVCG